VWGSRFIKIVLFAGIFMELMTPEDVQDAINALGLDIQIRFFDTPTATSQQAADNIGCALGQIAKSLGFMIEDQPVLVIASGDGRVDDRKLAALHNVSRKKVKVASADQLIAVFGYAPGSMPPFGHRTPSVPIWIDDALGRYDLIYAAGGANNAIFPITLAQLVEASGGKLADVRRDEQDA
jgi:prolyl-tRNA editing enzyme YbaK/EbsC (Cys-tRNA(Pro) deacylase)